MVDNKEDVARVIFSPKMIHNGILLPAAFELREQLKENYLSVLRMSIPTWKEEMQLIPNRRNRTAVAYSSLNVGEIRGLSDNDTTFGVEAFPGDTIRSLAGIEIAYKGQTIIGGVPLKNSSKEAESFIRMAIRYKLLMLARKNVHYISRS